MSRLFGRNFCFDLHLNNVSQNLIDQVGAIIIAHHKLTDQVCAIERVDIYRQSHTSLRDAFKKKNGKENDIVHLGPDPLPPEPIMTNLNNDKLVETGPPTLL